MLDSLLDNNYRHGTPLSSKNLQEAVSRVMTYTEKEEKYAKCNANNVNMDTFFSHLPQSMHKVKMQT